MLAVLALSCLVDPLVLLGLLHAFAHKQMDTTYKQVFNINLAVGIVALTFCVFVFPIDVEENPFPPSAQMAVAVLMVMTVALVAHFCQLGIPRASLVTVFFWAYKGALGFGFLRFLLVFGLEVDFQGLDIDDLGKSDAPELLDWLLEHGLWFKTEDS